MSRKGVSAITHADRNYPRRTRLRFVELLAYWEGRVNTTRLVHQFSISRQQASADIKAYVETRPGNLHYEASAKAHIANDTFEIAFIRGDADEYLNWVHTGHVSHAPGDTLPHIALTLPARRVSPMVMRGLIAAIRGQNRLEVDYVSLSNPNREGRIIAPHHFVKTGLRWHLRAWCEKSKQYRDFVLTRFRGTPDRLDKTERTAEGDVAWNTRLQLVLAPDPRLSEEKRAVLENDYQMTQGRLTLTTRACLVQYLLQEMQVNPKVLDGTPEAQQLVLVNRDDIKDWLFD